MRALLDIDSLLYAIGFAYQRKVWRVYIQDLEHDGYISSFLSKKEADEWIVGNEQDLRINEAIEVDPLSWTLASLRRKLEDILKAVGTQDYLMFISGKTNFRHNLATIKPYKGKRKDIPKPIHFEEMRRYLVEHWNAEIIEEIEPDDKVAILHREEHSRVAAFWGLKLLWSERDEGLFRGACSTILVSIDHDLDQVPGWRYNWQKDDKGVYWISEKEALYSLWIQVVMGCPGDDVPGIPGVGAKTAGKLLEGCTTEQEYKEAALKAYKDFYGGKALSMFLENARLVKMLEEPLTYDEEGAINNLWNPLGE